MLKKVEEFCEYAILSGEKLLRTIIKKKDKRNFIKGKISGYQSVLDYIKTLKEKEKK